MLLSLATAFLITTLLSLILTPFTKQIAKKIGAVDIPNERKVHTQPIPRLGGLGIGATLIISLLIYYLLFPKFFSQIVSKSTQAFLQTSQSLILIPALLMVFLMGVWDDITSLEPGPKFGIQFIASTLIYFAGFQITFFAEGTSIWVIDLNFLISYPLSVIWIVGITNAFNLIDGLDGLASGVGMIALSTIAIISFLQGQTGIALISILLCGATMGFLWYNFRPATIFLGDSGSLFLGFSLALLSIESFTKTSTAFAILVPLFVLGVPVIDTLLSMIRRFLSWFMPNNQKSITQFPFSKAFKSLFRPDKSHIHHQLLNRGLSHKNTVLVLYLVSIIFGVGALIVSTTEQYDTIIGVTFLLAVLIKLGISQLRYKEIDLFHNGIFFSFYKTLLINKRHLQKFLDSLFILVAFSASYHLINSNNFQSLLAKTYDAALVLGIIYITQIIVLWLWGIYKETIPRLGIADVITIVKGVASAVAASALIHFAFFQDILPFTYSAYILNFYFLGTLILGMRVSFHILKYLFYKSRKDNKRVLIYGAGKMGLLALHQLMNFNRNQFTPIGFLDEDPSLEGSVVNGFSVYGGHWKLKRLIKTKKVDELHIADPNINPEVLRRIRNIAQKYELKVRLIHTELRNLRFNNQSNKPTANSVNYAE